MTQFLTLFRPPREGEVTFFPLPLRLLLSPSQLAHPNRAPTLAMARRQSHRANSESDEAEETPSPPAQQNGGLATMGLVGGEQGVRLKDADGADISGSADDHQIMAILAHVSALALRAVFFRGRSQRVRLDWLEGECRASCWLYEYWA